MTAENVIVAQVVFEAKPFRRKLPLRRGDDAAYVLQGKKVQIVAGFDETTGKTVFMRAGETSVSLDELPHRRIDRTGVIYDATECEGSSPKNLRKKRTSQPWFDTEAEYRRRGGSGQQISKGNGWLLGAPPSSFR